MSLHDLARARARKAQSNASKQVKPVKVPFTKWQYETVHAFLDQLRISGEVEKELGAPIKIEVDWSPHNDEGQPHIYLQGSKAYKTIPLKPILEAAAPITKDDI